MAFRYYVTDTVEGLVIGTDERGIALEFAASDDYFVVDAKEGIWLTNDGDVPVPEHGA